jgi:hypothetical protein
MAKQLVRVWTDPWNEAGKYSQTDLVVEKSKIPELKRLYPRGVVLGDTYGENLSRKALDRWGD